MLVLVSIVLASALAFHSPSLSRAEQDAIARAYAPVFVFHPSERYLPTSPLYPLALDNVSQRDVHSANALAEMLGPVETRVARYDALSLAEKLSLATIHWRVYETSKEMGPESGPAVVAEYWCYYPFNDFEFHGGVLPIAVRDDHFHDLERVFIVLDRRDGQAPLMTGQDEHAWVRRTFRIRRIVGSAHDGAIPANRYDVPASSPEPATPIEIIVENGSHAMAADIDRDGLFTPGVDNSAPQSGGFVWGIRDHGEMWSAYRASFMDRRGPQSSIRLCPATDASAIADACAPYALASADDLQHWFEALHLTSDDRSRIVGHTSTTVRLFGDANIEGLMVPSDRPNGDMLHRMLRHGCDSERGILAGVITAVHSPAAVVGGRFAMPTRLSLVSEVLAEAVAIAPVGQKLKGETSLLGYYRADAIVKLVGGVGWFSENRGRVDGLGGLELRAGRLRVRSTMRMITRDVDTRIVLVF